MSKATKPKQKAHKLAQGACIPARHFHFLDAELKNCDNVQTKTSNLLSRAAFSKMASLTLLIVARVKFGTTQRSPIAPQVEKFTHLGKLVPFSSQREKNVKVSIPAAQTCCIFPIKVASG